MYKPVLEAAGPDATYEQFDLQGRIDFSSHIQRLLAANPDLLVNAATQTAGARALQARTELARRSRCPRPPRSATGSNLKPTSAEVLQGATMEALQGQQLREHTERGHQAAVLRPAAGPGLADHVMMVLRAAVGLPVVGQVRGRSGRQHRPRRTRRRAREPQARQHPDDRETFPGARYTADNHFPTLSTPPSPTPHRFPARSSTATSSRSTDMNTSASPEQVTPCS